MVYFNFCFFALDLSPYNLLLSSFRFSFIFRYDSFPVSLPSFFLSFSVSRWLAYVCWVCQSPTQWHCIVLLLSTWYNAAACIVALWPHDVYLSGMKNQHQHWMCWMAARNNGLNMKNTHMLQSVMNGISSNHAVVSLLSLWIIHMLLLSHFASNHV